MQSLLNTKLSVAKMLCEKMKEEGLFSSTVDTVRETTISDQDETSETNATDEYSENQTLHELQEEADEVIDMLANLLKGVAGVVSKEVAKHADDD